jgi:hypothetical protein
MLRNPNARSLRALEQLARSHRPGTSFGSTGSDQSAWSTNSRWSFASLYSIASAGSIASIGSAWSVLSIGSVGSILSIGSAGSILSIGSVGSILSIGGTGENAAEPDATVADANGGAVGRPHRFTIERGATLLTVAALLAALRA